MSDLLKTTRCDQPCARDVGFCVTDSHEARIKSAQYEACRRIYYLSSKPSPHLGGADQPYTPMRVEFRESNQILL